MSSASEADSQRVAAAGAAAPHSARGRLQSAFEDPLSALPETAQKLLLAAKEIIATEGFDALTLNSVSAASGENKAMISYYFGNKAGLVAAVLDSVIHDEYIASQDRMKDVDPKRRTQRLVEEMRRMDAAIEEFRVFFELLPHVLRDETLRRRIALLYTWYWSVKLEWLGITEARRALSRIPSFLASPRSSPPSSTDSPSRPRSTPSSTWRTPIASSTGCSRARWSRSRTAAWRRGAGGRAHPKQ